MRRMLTAGVVVAGLVALNARIDATHECSCKRACWCKRPGLRHFRWLVPIGHDL